MRTNNNNEVVVEDLCERGELTSLYVSKTKKCLFNFEGGNGGVGCCGRKSETSQLLLIAHTNTCARLGIFTYLLY